jgi:hypothetical protein
MDEQCLRSVIDEITLEVAQNAAGEQSPEALEEAISACALAHIKRLLADRTFRDALEAEHAIDAIIGGVLKRLQEVAAGGGQIGSG